MIEMNNKMKEDLMVLSAAAHKSAGNRLKETSTSKKYSCAEMIAKVHMEYKSMTYTLRRLVCDEQESHIVIQTGSPLSIDVVKNTYMYFKINVLGK